MRLEGDRGDGIASREGVVDQSEDLLAAIRLRDHDVSGDGFVFRPGEVSVVIGDVYQVGVGFEFGDGALYLVHA